MATKRDAPPSVSMSEAARVLSEGLVPIMFLYQQTRSAAEFLEGDELSGEGQKKLARLLREALAKVERFLLVD